jgi:hypothetical protein
MLQILQLRLAPIILLVLALTAVQAAGATWSEPDSSWQTASAEQPVVVRQRTLLGHHCLTPAPQPGTHLEGQPFAYGYFGAKAQSTVIYHRGSTGDWFQWTFQRGN